MTIDTDSATVELVLTAHVSVHDRLIAELDLLGFEAFLQDEGELRAYQTGQQWTVELENEIRSLLAELAIPAEPRVQIIAPENWNAMWESSVLPIEVGRFLVTPSWQPERPDRRDLVRLEIDPKMSFGTGYHATTRLMLHLLPSVVRNGDRVFDAGTGTGILAIASAKLGASSVLGVDNDPWSERNARENCELNEVSSIVDIRLADVNSIIESSFDVVLANIQLDVITASLPVLTNKLAPEGRILFSGILVGQSSTLTTAANGCGLTIIESRIEDEWWAASFRHE